MRKRLAALLTTVVLALSLLMAPSASASVPYSWWCHRGGYRDVHVWTPTSAAWWTVYMGYRCYGGRYSNV